MSLPTRFPTLLQIFPVRSEGVSPTVIEGMRYTGSNHIASAAAMDGLEL
jgi:hypothetical protein